MNRMHQFSELLSLNWTVADASREMGVSKAYGNALLQRIRKRLGPQAV
jgi:hypothetical protein